MKVLRGTMSENLSTFSWTILVQIVQRDWNFIDKVWNIEIFFSIEFTDKLLQLLPRYKQHFRKERILNLIQTCSIYFGDFFNTLIRMRNLKYFCIFEFECFLFVSWFGNVWLSISWSDYLIRTQFKSCYIPVLKPMT